MPIPKRLIRTVPEHPSAEQDERWEAAKALHPTWEHVDRRDPNDPKLFPLTSHLWPSCTSGSQKSDLIRAEELYHRGGFYVDSDVVCFKPFDTLCGLEGIAAFEDTEHICTAILGFAPGHPALKVLIDGGIEFHKDGAWAASIAVASREWPKRDDIALMPPGVFFPTHFSERWAGTQPSSEEVHKANPWSWCMHLWDGSWLEKPPA